MRNYEFANTNVQENLTCIRACLIKAVSDGEEKVTVFTSLCFIKENFDAIKEELKMKLGNLCRVRTSVPKLFCGYKMYGLEVHFLSNDKDLLRSHILDLFNGWTSSEIKTINKQKC